MLSLVTSYEEVLDNVKTFNNELNYEDKLVNKLGSFQHWYYIEELDMFAPSKFIGYKGNNNEEYFMGTRRDVGYMDGRDTVVTLKKWFIEVNDDVFENLYGKLSSMICQFDKKPNKRVHIHIKR